MAWRFEWASTWDAAWKAPFADRWYAAVGGNPAANVYHHPAVVRAWVETEGEALHAQPLFGWAHDGTREVLVLWTVLPYTGRFFTRHVLTPVGNALFGYHDPLLVSGELSGQDWSAFWEAARTSTQRKCDSALLRFVHNQYCADSARAEACGEESPVIRLEGATDFASVLARASSRYREDILRNERRMQERGGIEFWIATNSEMEQALADFEDFFVPTYAKNWQERGNMMERPGMLPFLRRLIAEGIPEGWAHYSRLSVGGTKVAWHLGFLHQGQLYYWIPTYVGDWKGYSPGKVHLAKLLEHAVARNYSMVHLLTGAHPYKMAWQPELPVLRSIRWYAPSLRGKAMRWYDVRRGRIRG